MINPPIATGIVSGDILIQAGIQAALDDIRQNPWLLDYVYAWLPADDLTKNAYCDSERTVAKKWVLNKIGRAHV